MVLYICEKFHENTSNGFQLTEWTQVHARNVYVQCSKVNNSKSRQTRVKVQELCSSSHQALNFWCVKFHQNIWKGFQMTKQTLVHGRNGYFQYDVQRAVTPAVVNYSYGSCVLHVDSWCFTFVNTFHENILKGFQLTEQIWVHGRNGYVQRSMGNKSKSRQTRVTAHVFCTSSYDALCLYEVSWKYHERYQTYGAGTSTL